jgi:hypothetical protein
LTAPRYIVQRTAPAGLWFLRDRGAPADEWRGTPRRPPVVYTARTIDDVMLWAIVKEIDEIEIRELAPVLLKWRLTRRKDDPEKATEPRNKGEGKSG